MITPVSLSELLRSQGKGTDASNFYDEEVSMLTRFHIYIQPHNNSVLYLSNIYSYSYIFSLSAQ